ncbi:MAG: pyridoxine 5'-phosphate synthase, partial [Myxococcales bacterium]|nr:pyridoxine 5'-phosphate synthase [Myxococcales bacterium]
ELHTGDYCEASTAAVAAQQLERLRVAAVVGHELGLIVAAGHGLDYRNVHAVAGLDHIEELNIGHSIVCRAVFVGFEQAVVDMLIAMNGVES